MDSPSVGTMCAGTAEWCPRDPLPANIVDLVQAPDIATFIIAGLLSCRLVKGAPIVAKKTGFVVTQDKSIIY